MTKKEIILLYIGDLKSKVTQSDARDNRIKQLETELQNTSSNSDYEKCKKCGYETVPMVYCPHCNGYITVPNEHFA